MSIERILVPVDGSSHSKRAVDVAGDLALHYGAEVIALHVVHGGIPRVPKDVAAYERYEHVHLTQRELLTSSGEEIVEQAEKQLRDCGVLDVSTRVDVGHPAQAIVDFVAAELGPEDVIVMGRRGLSNLPAVFLGSTSQKVAHLIDRTIVTVK
jgi:nucleotide-binding universal stress UspA family protein